MEDPELVTINVIEEEDAVYLYTEKMKSKMFGVPINLGANKAGIEFGIDVLVKLILIHLMKLKLLMLKNKKKTLMSGT